MKCAFLFCHYYFSNFIALQNSWFFFIIIEAKIYLEQDSRTVCVAVLHSLAVETWLAVKKFTLDLEDLRSKNAQWVTFMPLTPLFYLQEKKTKPIHYSVYFFCSMIGIKSSVFFFQMTFKRYLRCNELDSIIISTWLLRKTGS